MSGTEFSSEWSDSDASHRCRKGKFLLSWPGDGHAFHQLPSNESGERELSPTPGLRNQESEHIVGAWKMKSADMRGGWRLRLKKSWEPLTRFETSAVRSEPTNAVLSTCYNEDGTNVLHYWRRPLHISHHGLSSLLRLVWRRAYLLRLDLYSGQSWSPATTSKLA